MQLNRAVGFSVIATAVLLMSGCADRASESLNAGQTLVARGDVDGAIARFDEAVALAPEWWAPYYAKAKALRDRQRYAEAVTAYRVVEKLRPNDCETGYWLGRTLV